jgi:hypothetical protein
VDMHAPDEREAAALFDMARGCEPNRLHDWVKGAQWNRRAGQWYGDRPDERDMRGGSWLNRESGRSSYHVLIYKTDPAYEARMAAWAARLTEHEALAA